MPEEKQIVTIGMYGGCDFYDIKGIVEGLFDALGIKKFNIEPLDSDPTFHPGQTAVITIGQKKIAKLGTGSSKDTGKQR